LLLLVGELDAGMPNFGHTVFVQFYRPTLGRKWFANFQGIGRPAVTHPSPIVFSVQLKSVCVECK